MPYLLSLLIILSFGCTKNKDTNEKVLRFVSIGKIFGFDPVLGGDLYSSSEMGRVYEGLYEFHPTKRPYELMPNLAEGMPGASQDGLTYTFQLKKGVFFHHDIAFKEGKGRELRSYDVVYSIKRLADPKLQSRGWWLFDERVLGLNEWRERQSKLSHTQYDDEVMGLKVIDDYRFQVILRKPFPQLLYAFAMPFTFVVAKEVVDKYGPEFLNHPVGTGPFLLSKFDQSNQIVYTRNPNFREKFHPSEVKPHLKIPLVDKVVVEIIIEQQPAWLAFLRGKIDVLGIPKDNFKDVIDEERKLKKEYQAKGINLFYGPMLDLTFITFNHENPLLRNVKLRRAMSLAYNRDEHNRLFYNGTALPAQGVIPPGMAGYRTDFVNPYVKYDLELAKKTLKEAGYPEGKGLPELTVETGNSTVDRQSSEFFAKEMAKLGIKIKVGQNTWPELVNKVSKGNFELYTMAWGADYPDAENFLGLLYCPNKAPGNNGSNYCNPEFDEIFRKAVVMQDSPERTKLYEKLNQMVGEEMAMLFMFHRTKFSVQQGWVENYELMEFNHTQGQYLGVDLEVKKKLLDKF